MIRFTLGALIAATLSTAPIRGGESDETASRTIAEQWAPRLQDSIEDAVRREAAGDAEFVTSPPPKWTIAALGDEIAIAREVAVEMSAYAPGRHRPEESSRPIGKQSLRLVLRFASPLPMDECERLAAINQASEDQEGRLRRRVADIPHKFDDYLANTPEEKQRMKAFREAAAKLPRHKLPTFYAPDASVYLTYHWHPWAYPSEEKVQGELRAIEERLVQFFGLYDDDSWSRNMSIGEHVDVDRPREERDAKRQPK